MSICTEPPRQRVLQRFPRFGPTVSAILRDPEVAIPGAFSRSQLPTFIHWSAIDLQRRGNDGSWHKAAVPAWRVQRQVHHQNLTLSEQSAGQKLRPQLGRLPKGRSWLAGCEIRRSFGRFTRSSRRNCAYPSELGRIILAVSPNSWYLKNATFCRICSVQLISRTNHESL